MYIVSNALPPKTTDKLLQYAKYYNGAALAYMQAFRGGRRTRENPTVRKTRVFCNIPLVRHTPGDLMKDNV